MKKFYTLFIIAAFAAAACQKEIPNDAQTGTPVGPTELTDDNGNPILNPVSISFDASSITKVAIDADGKASWEAGDKIKICCLDAEGTAKYITSGEVNLTDGTFTAVVEDADTYYAVYPSTLEVEQTAESFAVRFKSGRNVSTQFKDAAWYAAKTTKDAKSFAFKSISTVLKFDVENPDAESVYFRSMGGGLTALCAAKYFPVDFADDGSVAVKKPATPIAYITFGGMNGAGTYYLTLPAVGEKAISDDDVPLDGFMLKLNGSTSGIPAAYYSSPITLTPGKLYNLSTSVDDKIVWDYYISETGSGTGLTVDSPASLTHLQTSGNPAFIAIKGKVSMLRDGANFHIIGTFDKPISVINQKQDRVVNIIPHQGSKFTLNVNKAEVTVSFSDQTVSDGSVAFNVSAGTLNIDNATFSKYASPLFTVSGGQVNVNNTIFEENTKQIFSVSGGNLTLKDSKIIDNTFSDTNEAAIVITDDFTGKFYLTNCIFAGNKQSHASKNVGIAIQCANNANQSAFLGINNCLFFNNAGTTSANNPSHMNLGFAHCILNTTIVSQAEDGLLCKQGIRCGATGGATASLLANNIISNEYEDQKDFNNASSSYSLRLKGYNLYTDYTNSSKKVVISGTNGTVPAYKWNPSTYAWTWDGSTTTEDMVSMSELETLITDDKIDGESTVVCLMATEFLEWLKAQSYPNGNAFTVDLYGNSRGEGVCWPGCYQLN